MRLMPAGRDHAPPPNPPAAVNKSTKVHQTLHKDTAGAVPNMQAVPHAWAAVNRPLVAAGKSERGIQAAVGWICGLVLVWKDSLRPFGGGFALKRLMGERQRRRNLTEIRTLGSSSEQGFVLPPGIKLASLPSIIFGLFSSPLVPRSDRLRWCDELHSLLRAQHFSFPPSSW